MTLNTDVKKYFSAWSSPSNIALIKYWGKRPQQLPSNPSVSFTLKNAVTHLAMKVTTNSAKKLELNFTFENKTNEKFQKKILNFLETQINRFPWLASASLEISSSNTFPHSSGIASSASSMSALCLCLVTIDEEITLKKNDQHIFLQEVSRLSRLASGSASRSVYPFMASWGMLSEVYASAVDKKSVHPMFHHFSDSIVIVDAEEKSVSSRAGHALMEGHPFREQRFLRARSNMDRLNSAMIEGDMNAFIEIVEEEALMLHALMMTSNPSYLLLKPQSLTVIDELRKFRILSGIPVCFTIDAGPNIHVLYPSVHNSSVRSWMSERFSAMGIIHDEVGEGPQRLKINE